MKIEQQADGSVDESHVAEQLSDVNRENSLHGLGFDDEAMVDEEVESQRFFKGQVLVDDRNGKFLNGWNPTEAKLMPETASVNTLEQPGPLMAVHLDRCPDDVRCPSIRAVETYMSAHLPVLPDLPVQVLEALNRKAGKNGKVGCGGFEGCS